MGTGAQTRPGGTGMTRVLVVDDHKTFSDLLSLALSAQPDLTCVGTAHSAAEAIRMTGALTPDVVVLDVRLGEEDGIAVARTLTAQHPQMRVVILTAFADSALLHRAAVAGACSLVPKDGSLPDVLQALRSARLGGFSVHPALLRTLVRVAPEPGHPRPALSPREREVLSMLASGLDVSTIARNLHISHNTCRGYVKNILTKLDAHSQLQAVVTARAQGLIDGQPLT